MLQRENTQTETKHLRCEHLALLFAKGRVHTGRGGPARLQDGRHRSWDTERRARSHSTAENGTEPCELLHTLLILTLGLILNLSQVITGAAFCPGPCSWGSTLLTSGY